MQDIGVDQTSIKKGHPHLSLLVDLVRKRSLFITEGKDHRTISKFAQTLETSGGKRENIRKVSCDRSPAFIKGINQEFSQAKITFDKFQVLKIINKAMDALRRAEAKKNPILKGTRYVFLRIAKI